MSTSKTAVTRYREKSIVRIPLDLNRTTDADILAYLETVENRQGLIKALLRKKMKGE